MKLTEEQVETLIIEAFHIGWRQSREWPNHRPGGIEVTWDPFRPLPDLKPKNPVT